MTKRRTTIVVLVLALVAATAACTPTDVAVSACVQRDDVQTLSDPAGGIGPVYRPAVWGAPLADGGGVDARAIRWRIPEAGLDTGASIGRVTYAAWLGLKEDPGHHDVCMVGGAIVDLTSHATTTWSEWHQRSSVINLTAPRAQLIGTKIYNVADGVSIRRPGDDWTLRGVHIRAAHDDCVQNDDLLSGLIEDSFLDGCYVAVSASEVGAPDNGHETVTIRGSLVRMQPMPHVYKPEEHVTPGYATVFKWARYPEQGHSPRLAIHDTVFVLEQHGSIKRATGYHADLLPVFDPDGKNGPLPAEPYLDPADCSGNTVVWLGPGDPGFDDLPPCFTVLTGQTARNFWAATRAEWLDTHPLAWQPDEDPGIFDYDELAP